MISTSVLIGSLIRFRGASLAALSPDMGDVARMCSGHAA
jgi:hypothetical protein